MSSQLQDFAVKILNAEKFIIYLYIFKTDPSMTDVLYMWYSAIKHTSSTNTGLSCVREN